MTEIERKEKKEENGTKYRKKEENRNKAQIHTGIITITILIFPAKSPVADMARAYRPTAMSGRPSFSITIPEIKLYVGGGDAMQYGNFLNNPRL